MESRGAGRARSRGRSGARLGAVVLDKDVIKAALLRSGIAEERGGARARTRCTSPRRRRSSTRVTRSCSTIRCSGRASRSGGSRSRAAGSPAILIECVCADRDELVRRLATRPRWNRSRARRSTCSCIPDAPRPRSSRGWSLDTTRANRGSGRRGPRVCYGDAVAGPSATDASAARYDAREDLRMHAHRRRRRRSRCGRRLHRHHVCAESRRRVSAEAAAQIARAVGAPMREIGAGRAAAAPSRTL